jgi:hypothetical protein
VALGIEIMKPRKKIQQGHEDAVIDQFLSWYNSKHRTEFKVFEKPQPPDALARDKDKVIWIEHADIYRSWGEAREERSAVTPGETPYERQEHPIFEPDKRVSAAFISTMDKKLSKDSYEKWYEKYGPGILVLTERDPLFDQSTWDSMSSELDSCSFENDKGYFKEAFLGYRSRGGLAFIEIEYQNS